MSNYAHLIGLDVGSARIGVAMAHSPVPIALSHGYISVDGTEVATISKLISDENIQCVVVGYPRNQSGEPTAQTEFVSAFADTLRHLAVDIVFQDESLTSVMAEQRLKQRGKSYEKGDIDAEAATIILQDYLDLQS